MWRERVGVRVWVRVEGDGFIGDGPVVQGECYRWRGGEGRGGQKCEI